MKELAEGKEGKRKRGSKIKERGKKKKRGEKKRRGLTIALSTFHPYIEYPVRMPHFLGKRGGNPEGKKGEGGRKKGTEKITLTLKFPNYSHTFNELTKKGKKREGGDWVRGKEKKKKKKFGYLSRLPLPNYVNKSSGRLPASEPCKRGGKGKGPSKEKKRGGGKKKEGPLKLFRRTQ